MKNSNVLIKYNKCPYSELNKHKRKRGCSKQQKEQFYLIFMYTSLQYALPTDNLKNPSTISINYHTRLTVSFPGQPK